MELESRTRFLGVLLVIGGNEARPQYLQWPICEHHGVPVRVFFRRSSEHHSRNDSSSSTSWSHDSHVFLTVVPWSYQEFL